MSDGAVTDDVIESGVGVAVDDRGVGRLTISRPERMNALDTGATVAIIDTLAAWSARDDIRAVVIDGAGGSFSTKSHCVFDIS